MTKTLTQRLKPLAATQFTIETTQFRVQKLTPMEAKDVFEVIRVGLAEAGVKATSNADGEATGASIMMLLGLPIHTVNWLIEAMFRTITYKRPDTTENVLGGDEDTGFNGLEMIHVYEVLGRSLIANFIGSLDVVISRFPQLGMTLQAITDPPITPT